MRKYLPDIIIISSILLISLIFMIIINNNQNGRGKTFTVTVNGEITESYDINIDQVIRIKGYDGYNVISVTNGEISVTDADCRDGSCIISGPISRVGQSIVCLPNRLVISVDGDNIDKEYDSIVY